MDSQGWKTIQWSLSPPLPQHTPVHLGMSACPQYLLGITYPCLHTSRGGKLITPKAALAVVGRCWLLESSFLY